jgi:hypothetical protein
MEDQAFKAPPMDAEWNDAALCPKLMLVVSDKYGLVEDPVTHAVRPMHAPKDEEEAAQQYRNYQAWMAETYIEGIDVEDDVERLDQDPEDLVDVVEGDATQGRKRGPTVLVCHYEPCRQRIASVPESCPPGTDESSPDLPYPFCSKRCAKAWALYCVGMPLCDKMAAEIDVRAGYIVDPAAAPFEALLHQMSELSMSKQEGTKAAHFDPETVSLPLGLPPERMDESQDTLDAQAPEAAVAAEQTVGCRACSQRVSVSLACRQVYLETASTWCFCSQRCMRSSNAYSAGDLMDPVAFADLQSRGQAELLRRPRWGTEPNDI